MCWIHMKNVFKTKLLNCTLRYYSVITPETHENITKKFDAQKHLFYDKTMNGPNDYL